MDHIDAHIAGAGHADQAFMLAPSINQATRVMNDAQISMFFSTSRACRMVSINPATLP
jgi:hypothetical protein